jgi:hypothetical protein
MKDAQDPHNRDFMMTSFFVSNKKARFFVVPRMQRQAAQVLGQAGMWRSPGHLGLLPLLVGRLVLHVTSTE